MAAQQAILALPAGHVDTASDFSQAAAHGSVDPSLLAALGDQDPGQISAAADAVAEGATARLSELETARSSVLPGVTQLGSAIKQLEENRPLLDVTTRAGWDDFIAAARPTMKAQGMKPRQISEALTDPFERLRSQLGTVMDRVTDQFEQSARVRLRELSEARLARAAAQLITATDSPASDATISAHIASLDATLNAGVQQLVEALNFRRQGAENDALHTALSKLHDICSITTAELVPYARTTNIRLSQSHSRDIALTSVQIAGLLRKSFGLDAVADLLNWQASWPETTSVWKARASVMPDWQDPAPAAPLLVDFASLRASATDIDDVAVCGDVVAIDFDHPRSIVHLSDGSAAEPIRCVAVASRFTTVGAVVGGVLSVAGSWQLQQPGDGQAGLFVTRVGGWQRRRLPVTSTNAVISHLFREVQHTYAATPTGLRAVASFGGGALAGSGPLVWSAWFRAEMAS